MIRPSSLRWLAPVLLWGLGGCASLPMVDAPSVNHSARVRHLVLHFTSEPFDESRRLLTERTDRPVSVHYLVPEPGDPTYPHSRLKIFRLVPETRRAWHAGRSVWAGHQALNGSSIGIELVNRSHCVDLDPEAEIRTPDMQDCTFQGFPEAQIDLLIRLVQDILARHPDIDPVDVVGHADVAPTRRLDPGPTFPWKRLHEHGIGAWPDDTSVEHYRRRFTEEPASPELVRRALGAYGYGIEPEDGDDAELHLQFVVRAFQMHFRPARTDGVMDLESTAILFALLDKYRPHALENLLDRGSD